MIAPAHPLPGKPWLLPLRVGAYRFCERGRGRRIGTGLYREVARIVGGLLGKCPGVAGVALRGGAVERCRPGMSDLDFLVVLEPGLGESRRIASYQALRRAYRAVGRLLLLPGEVLCYEGREWQALSGQSPGLIPGLHRRRVLAGEVPAHVSPPRISPQGRLLLAHQLYYHAALCCQAPVSRTERDFLRYRARRYLEKARGLLESPQELPEGPLPELLADTAVMLNHASARLLVEHPAPAAGPLARKSAGISEPALSEASRQWRSRRREHPLSPLPWPWAFSVGSRESVAALYGERQRSAAGPVPLLVMEFSGWLLRSGLHWGPWESHLTPGTWSLFERSPFRDHLAFHTRMALRERALTYAALLGGELLWKPKAALGATLALVTESLIRICEETAPGMRSEDASLDQLREALAQGAFDRRPLDWFIAKTLFLRRKLQEVLPPDPTAPGV